MEYLATLEAIKGNDTNINNEHLAVLTIIPEAGYDISTNQVQITAETVTTPKIVKTYNPLAVDNYTVVLDFSAEETKRMKASSEITIDLLDQLGRIKTIGILLLQLKKTKMQYLMHYGILYQELYLYICMKNTKMIIAL